MSATPSLLHVEDLSSNRQKGLSAELRAVRSAEGRVSFDDEQFALFMLVLRQSTSLAGRADDSKAVLRRATSRCCRAASRTRMHSPPCPARLGRTPSSLAEVSRTTRPAVLDTTLATIREPLASRGLLRLAFELRFRDPNSDDRRHSFENVVLDDVVFPDLRIFLPGLLIEDFGDRAFEARDVRPTARGSR